MRGYGLVDSPRVSARPGQALDLDAVAAPDALAAARVYPAAWWLSMMELPEGEHSQQELGSSVTGCLNCHQIGNRATREIPGGILSAVDSHLEAWDRRAAMGPMGAAMAGAFRRLGPQRAMFADWTARIAAGEAPAQTPPRPTGAERNVVVTLWDWGTEHDGRTDATPSDVRDATVNADGLVYGVVQPSDILAVIDPVEHRAATIPIPSGAPRILTDTPTSPYYGDEPIWARASDPRSVAMDGEGRVWLTGRVRAPDEQPDFCTDGGNPYADYFPLEVGTRQVFLYDPPSEAFSEIDTCFSADHNQLGHDERFYYGFRDGVGWVDVELWDETGDAEASQGWVSDGHRHQRRRRHHPRLDGAGRAGRSGPRPPRRLRLLLAGRQRRRRQRLVLGQRARRQHPRAPRAGREPARELHRRGLRAAAERHEPAALRQRGTASDPRRTRLAGLARQRPLRLVRPERVHGDERPHRHRAELSRGLDLPPHGQAHLRERRDADQLGRGYLTQIDHHDVLGFGLETPVYGVVNTDSLEVFLPATGEFVTLRVPYPMGFFSRSSVGRIDDPDAGWKGKGLWVELLQLCRVAPGRRAGDAAEGGEVPGPAAPAGEVGRRGPEPGSRGSGRRRLEKSRTPGRAARATA